MKNIDVQVGKISRLLTKDVISNVYEVSSTIMMNVGRKLTDKVTNCTNKNSQIIPDWSY